MDQLLHSNFCLPTTTQTSGVVTPGRSGTPDSEILNEHIDPLQQQNPFATPYQSHLPSKNTSSAAIHQAGLSQRYFHSRRIKKGEIDRPWTKTKDPREKWVTIIPLVGLLIGVILAGFLVWDGLRSVITHTY